MLDSTSLPCVMTDTWRDGLAHGEHRLVSFPPVGRQRDRATQGTALPSARYRNDRRDALCDWRLRHDLAPPVECRRRNPHSKAVGSGFVSRPGTDPPVIGRLTGSEFERLNAVRGRIHALRDIAPDRWSNRSKRPVKSFTVEHRHPKRRDFQKGAAT